MLSTSKRPQRGTIFPTSRQLACFHLFSMKPGEPASGDPGKTLAWNKAAARGGKEPPQRACGHRHSARGSRNYSREKHRPDGTEAAPRSQADFDKKPPSGAGGKVNVITSASCPTRPTIPRLTRSLYQLAPRARDCPLHVRTKLSLQQQLSLKSA